MNHLQHNRAAWNKQAQDGNRWTLPVDAATIARARAGDWQVVLTPSLPVPRAWFGDLAGKDVLCLASGGGQQAPILAAAGARVLSLDLSDEQLARDHLVSEREGLDVRCEQGDMADLSRLADASFDLIFHPVSNVFVPDVLPVWRECRRVLRPGCDLLAGFMNPSAFLFDEDDDQAELLTVRYPLPYTDRRSLAPDRLARRLAAGEPLTHSHTLDTQIGGQIAAGLALIGFYEDPGADPAWTFSRYSPVAMATRARGLAV